MTVLVAVGLGFGDEGKGSVCDHLVRKHRAHCVVRFNGGAQAAHNVVTDDGRQHTFAQFGSGTFAGAKTFLSRHMLVNPYAMFTEARHLDELGVNQPLNLVTVDQDALVTTPFHISANRLKEMARSNGRHGSCGMGIGETARLAEDSDFELSLMVGDIFLPRMALSKLQSIQARLLKDTEAIRETIEKTPAVQQEIDILLDPNVAASALKVYQEFVKQVQVVGGTYLNERILSQGTTVFEGAQGVLLDQNYGFFPYVTRSNTTDDNALDLLAEYDGSRMTVGILRSYATRHGAGPFVTEDPDINIPDLHNQHGPWQEGWRVGHFDMVMARYALDAMGGVDELVITHMDRIPKPHRICLGYQSPNQDPDTQIKKIRLPEAGNLKAQERVTDFLKTVRPIYATSPSPEGFLRYIEAELKTEISLCSYGPRSCDKKTRSRIQNVA